MPWHKGGLPETIIARARTVLIAQIFDLHIA
jgi:3',5'-cyclic AMP phosphodiesterase CpdA